MRILYTLGLRHLFRKTFARAKFVTLAKVGWVTKNILSQDLCFGWYVKLLVSAAFVHQFSQGSCGGLWSFLFMSNP
jgi:hypothetical protein